MERRDLIRALNDLFPSAYIQDPEKGIGLTLVYHRRQVVGALRKATSVRDTEALARTLFLRQPGTGRILWEQREAILTLLESAT